MCPTSSGKGHWLALGRPFLSPFAQMGLENSLLALQGSGMHSTSGSCATVELCVGCRCEECVCESGRGGSAGGDEPAFSNSAGLS